MSGLGTPTVRGNMAVTVQLVEQMAPDQRSLTAASKLMKPAKWPLLRLSQGDHLIWGECQGSGANPYRISVNIEDKGYKCSCPSRKFPCKHVLALLWMFADDGSTFAPDTTLPQWVQDWLARRRTPKGTVTPTGGLEGDQHKSIGAAKLQKAKKKDPAALKRAEAAAGKRKTEREKSIRLAIGELDQWLSDQLGHGLASLASDLSDRCRMVAIRMVDAKASGLGSWLDNLPSRYYALPEPKRADFLIEEFGKLYLLGRAYLQQDELPELLRADVRRLVGWSQNRAELLEDKQAQHVDGHWTVLTVLSEIQNDGLQRFETWLMRTVTKPKDTQPRFAVLMDFLPVSGGTSAPPFTPGEQFGAELVFYISVQPLRAIIAQRKPPEEDEPYHKNTKNSDVKGTPWGNGYDSLEAGLSDYEANLAFYPWLHRFPCIFSNVVLQKGTDDQLYLVADDTQQVGQSVDVLALPLPPKQHRAITPLLCLETLSCVGLWDGDCFQIFAIHSVLGLWYYQPVQR